MKTIGDVVINALPAGFLDGLPEQDQAAISSAVGRPLSLVDCSDGRAELEYRYRGDIHTIWVDMEFLLDAAGNSMTSLYDSAYRASINHHSVLVAGGACGCFHCLKTFDAADVVNWGGKDDTTTLCPFCYYDTVLSSKPSFLLAITTNQLKSGKNSPGPSKNVAM